LKTSGDNVSETQKPSTFSLELSPEIANLTCDHCGNPFESVNGVVKQKSILAGLAIFLAVVLLTVRVVGFFFLPRMAGLHSLPLLVTFMLVVIAYVQAAKRR
jgi:1,4-dihydroxy-2-naphthoate octaprenyltransferase